MRSRDSSGEFKDRKNSSELVRRRAVALTREAGKCVQPRIDRITSALLRSIQRSVCRFEEHLHLRSCFWERGPSEASRHRDVTLSRRPLRLRNIGGHAFGKHHGVAQLRFGQEYNELVATVTRDDV